MSFSVMAWYLDGNWGGLNYDIHAQYMLADIFVAINERWSLRYGYAHSRANSLLQYKSASWLPNDTINDILEYEEANEMIQAGLDNPVTYGGRSIKVIGHCFMVFSEMIESAIYPNVLGGPFVHDANRVQYTSLEHLCSLNDIRYFTDAPHCPFSKCGTDIDTVDHNPFNWYRAVLSALNTVDISHYWITQSTGVAENAKRQVYELSFPYQLVTVGTPPFDYDTLEAIVVSDDDAYGEAVAALVESTTDDSGVVIDIANRSVWQYSGYPSPTGTAISSFQRYVKLGNEWAIYLNPNPFLAGSSLEDVIAGPFVYSMGNTFEAVVPPPVGPLAVQCEPDADIVSLSQQINFLDSSDGIYFSDTVLNGMDGAEISVPITNMNWVSEWSGVGQDERDRIVVRPAFGGSVPIEITQDPNQSHIADNDFSDPYSVVGSHNCRLTLTARRLQYEYGGDSFIAGYADISGAMTVA